eukprot:jgi/Botrbrau1/8926/Bobra.0148s0039.1
MPYHTAYPQAPKDRVNLVYWLMCLLGISALLPYNVMLTEAEYYTVRTHQEPTIEILADNFETILVNSYTVGNLLTFLLLVPYGKHLTVNVQMLVPLWTILVVVGSQAAMALVPQLSGKVVIIVTMAGASLLGVVSAMFLSGVYALASWFPPIYTQAVVAGNGMAGLSLSGLSFLTAWRAVRNDHRPDVRGGVPARVRVLHNRCLSRGAGPGGVHAAALHPVCAVLELSGRDAGKGREGRGWHFDGQANGCLGKGREVGEGASSSLKLGPRE